MRRLALVAVLLASCVSAAVAEMDPYAAWMSSHPLTRMDWFIHNGEETANFRLAGPAAGDFKKEMRSKGFEGTVALMSFDYGSSRVSFDVTTIKDNPTSKDCVVALDAVRDRLATTHALASELATPQGREEAVERLVKQMAETPSKLTYPGEPRDLASHFAKTITVRVDFLGVESLSCFGSLAGTDASIRVK